jgi:hypothetical protein
LQHQGSLGATKPDINTFLNADKVSMPTNLLHVASALRQYRILIQMLLKSTHPLTTEFDCFCITWTQEEGDMDELREATPYFTALVPRWLQVRLAYCFSEQSCLGGANMDAPKLLELFQKIKLQEQWQPKLPAHYLPLPPSPAPAPPAPDRTPYVPPRDRQPAPQQQPQQPARTPATPPAPQEAVRNTAYDSRFTRFNDMRIPLATVLAANRDNPPPKNAAGVPMCCAYQIRGKCYTRCQRAGDHKPQSPDEATELFDWCVPCFANAAAARA